MRQALPSKRPLWILLAAALLFHTLLFSLQSSRGVDSGRVRHWLLDSLARIEKTADVAIDGVRGVWQSYFALTGVRSENEVLRSEIDRLQMQLARQSEDVLEAARLRRLLDLQEPSLGKTVVARVVGRDPSPVRSHLTITIDKGRNHGIRPDTSVMTPAGVVGRVISAGDSFSIVQLIVDSQSAVSVMVRSTRRQGIVRGIGTRDLKLEYIDDDSELKEGDELITSGLDRVHPKGLLLGVVTQVKPGAGLLKDVTIRPAVDLGRLEEVLCITEPPKEAPVPASVSNSR